MAGVDLVKAGEAVVESRLVNAARFAGAFIQERSSSQFAACVLLSLGNSDGLLLEVGIRNDLNVLPVHQDENRARCVVGLVVFVYGNCVCTVQTCVLGNAKCDSGVIGKIDCLEDIYHSADTVDINIVMLKYIVNAGNTGNLFKDSDKIVDVLLELSDGNAVLKLLLKSGPIFIFREDLANCIIYFLFGRADIFDNFPLIIGQHKVYGAVKVGVDACKHHVDVDPGIVRIKCNIESLFGESLFITGICRCELLHADIDMSLCDLDGEFKFAGLEIGVADKADSDLLCIACVEVGVFLAVDITPNSNLGDETCIALEGQIIFSYAFGKFGSFPIDCVIKDVLLHSTLFLVVGNGCILFKDDGACNTIIGKLDVLKNLSERLVSRITCVGETNVGFGCPVELYCSKIKILIIFIIKNISGVSEFYLYLIKLNIFCNYGYELLTNIVFGCCNVNFVANVSDAESLGLLFRSKRNITSVYEFDRYVFGSAIVVVITCVADGDSLLTFGNGAGVRELVIGQTGRGGAGNVSVKDALIECIYIVFGSTCVRNSDRGNFVVNIDRAFKLGYLIDCSDRLAVCIQLVSTVGVVLESRVDISDICFPLFSKYT